MDALRVFAIGTVFVAHCAHVFVPWRPWHVKSPVLSPAVGQVAVAAWPWVMPLFMLLAGAGAWYSLGHRSRRDYLLERARSLVLPFFVGTLTLIPPQIWIERRIQGRFDGPLWAFWPRFFDGVYPEGNLSAGHLWFLGYLFVYAVVTLPLVVRLGSPAGARMRRRLAAVLDRPWRIVVVPALGLAVGQVALRARFPESLAFIDDWAHHALLLPCFLFGAVWAATPVVDAALKRGWAQGAAVGLPGILIVMAMVLAAPEPGGLPTGWGLRYSVFWSAFSLASWGTTVALVGGAHRIVRGGSPFLERASRAVFPFYVLHQTVVVAVAWPLVRAGFSPGVTFIALVGVAGAVTVALVEAARPWLPGRLLLGFRPARPYSSAS